MNIILIAVIGVLILAVALIALKKITAGKKRETETPVTGEPPGLQPESNQEDGPVQEAEPESSEIVADTALPSEDLTVATDEIVDHEAKAEDEEDTPLKDIEETVELAEELIPPTEPDQVSQEPAIAEEMVEPEQVFTPEEETGTQEHEDKPLAVFPETVFELSKEEFAASLTQKEEAHRLAVAEAINKGEDKLRDTLQLELVAINEKLALIEDSYQQQQNCYQEAMQLLHRCGAYLDHDAITEAQQELSWGKPHKAEKLLEAMAEMDGDDQALAAFCGARLAATRFDLETAFTKYQHAIAIAPENPDYLHPAGLAAKQMYKYSQAIEWLTRCIAACEKDDDADPVVLAGIKRDLAYTYVVAGQSQKAGPLYKEAMAVFTEKLGQDHPELATCWFQIAELQETIGEYDKAVTLYKKALSILDAAKGGDHPVLAPILAKLAALCMELELEKEAVPLYEQLVKIREATLPPTHPQLNMSLNSLAESYKIQGKYPEAETCYLKTLAIAEKTQGEYSPAVGAVLQELAKVCLSQRKNEEAQAYQDRATAIFDKVVAEQEKQSQDSSLSLEL